MRLTCLVALLFSLNVWAIPNPHMGYSPAPHWQCQLNATLRGNPRYFMTYGRDSWDGEGELRCRTKDGDNVTRRLDVSFLSEFDGFGAGYLSTVDLRIFISTYQHPEELLFRATVNDIDGGPNLRFAMASELSEARVYVLSLSPEAAFRSLKSGTMFIRGQSEPL
jgi:hypothetical protein